MFFDLSRLRQGTKCNSNYTFLCIFVLWFWKSLPVFRKTISFLAWAFRIFIGIRLLWQMRKISTLFLIAVVNVFCMRMMFCTLTQYNSCIALPLWELCPSPFKPPGLGINSSPSVNLERHVVGLINTLQTWNTAVCSVF